MKISYYQTSSGRLIKAFCSLAEKCYYTGNKTTVLVNDQALAINLDQTLWTYSKKHFIPHALSTEQHPEKQPILISTDLEIKFPSPILMLINLSKDKVLDLLASKEKIQKYNISRCIFLNDEYADNAQIMDIIKKSHIGSNSFESYVQNNLGTWGKV